MAESIFTQIYLVQSLAPQDLILFENGVFIEVLKSDQSGKFYLAWLVFLTKGVGKREIVLALYTSNPSLVTNTQMVPKYARSDPWV